MPIADEQRAYRWLMKKDFDYGVWRAQMGIAHLDAAALLKVSVRTSYNWEARTFAIKPIYIDKCRELLARKSKRGKVAHG